MAEDRRVGRTKRLLKRAILDLIEEVGYDRITVAMLTERADVGRSTFYSHFDSKEDLLFDGFEEWVARVGEPAAPSSPKRPVRPDGGEASAETFPGGGVPEGFRFARPLLHHIADKGRFFQATMVKSRSSRIRRRITHILVRRIQGELARMGRAADEASAHAVAGAFLELAVWWLADGLRTPVAEVERTFQSVVA